MSPKEEGTRRRRKRNEMERQQVNNPYFKSPSILLNKSNCLHELPNHRQKSPLSSTIMELNVIRQRFSSIAYICLAVILSTQTAITIQNVNAEQQDLQLVSHHSHSQNALFKDLSGPTSGKIQTLDVICGKNFMTVRAEFSGPFYGIVFSKGTYGQENCIYVKPNSGLTHAAFNVYYDQCGTKPDLQGKFYENTIVIQYGSDIIEAYDEAKRLRCEWFEAYEKPATFKPAIPVADLEVVEMNFQGDDIDCWMEIQEGTGPWSREVSKIVPVGQPMTIVVAINDYNGQFDMRVKSCVAHDGVQQPIALTDEYGCVLRPKMLTPFTKVKNPGAQKKATVLSYSRFLAFKFPDSMTVQIQCTVEVCRHGCAEACQRVPSIAATTLQPELSLTAKWPSSPSIEGPRPPKQPTAAVVGGGDAHESQYKPARMQFNQRPSTPDTGDNYRPHHYAFQQQPPAPQPAPSHGDIPDDMSGSDSNHQPHVMMAHQPHSTQQSAMNSNRRLQEPAQAPGAQFSQFSMYPPNKRGLYNRLPYIVNQPPSSSPTAAPTTSTTTTTTTSQAPLSHENNRAGGLDEVPELANEEQTLTRLNTPSEPVSAPKTGDAEATDSSSSSATVIAADQQDNKPEASQVKPSVSLPEQLDNQPAQQSTAATAPAAVAGQSSAAADQSADTLADNNKPSVQGGDEQAGQGNKQDGAEQMAANQGASASSIGQSGSSLKTVEVEIPANDDPVRTLMASTSASNNPAQAVGVSFNSNRLSNVDLSANGGYNSVYSETGSNSQSVGGYQSVEQIIQPRELQAQQTSAEKRDKSEDSNIEAMIANSKSRFGARSQPQSNVAQVAPPAEPIRHYNHQMSSSAMDSQQDGGMQTDKESSELINSQDKVLIDRSDDSSSLAEIAGSSSQESNNNNESPNKPEVVSSHSDTSLSVEDSSIVAADSSNNNGKVKPVVGTEELATGPIQIEDRIGAPAQESLEEALTRLQQQIPQTAALVSASSQDSQAQQQQEQKSAQVANDKPDQRTDASGQQAEAPKIINVDGSNDRLDSINSMLAQYNKHKQAEMVRGGQQQNQKMAQNSVNQPYPNVAGQAKVISDPSSSLSTRNTMIAQASNVESVPSAVSPASQVQATPSVLSQVPIGKQPEPQQQQQQQPGISSKPVAQITNVPINIGFPQSQIPAIQQLSQQLAYFQRQQQQQQQVKQTTAKPARGRFNLLSPQAALQAVASRFLPKSQSQSQQQQQQQPQHQLPVAQQLPQLLNSIKLSAEQQQKLFSSSPMQQQQAQNFFLSKQAQQQQQYLPNRSGPSGPQQQLSQVQPPHSGGLFGRLSSNPSNVQQQSQQLVRSRRSAIMPNGKRGNGEVGITKTFMVVTGMDLAFWPNSTETELPPILEGRRLVEDDVIYGVCMPVVSLTFVLTCAFWLIVFIFSFCVYMLMKSRRQQDILNGNIQRKECSSPIH